MTENLNRNAAPGMGSNHPGATLESTAQHEYLAALESAILAAGAEDPPVGWIT